MDGSRLGVLYDVVRSIHAGESEQKFCRVLLIVFAAYMIIVFVTMVKKHVL